MCVSEVEFACARVRSRERIARFVCARVGLLQTSVPLSSCSDTSLWPNGNDCSDDLADSSPVERLCILLPPQAPRGLR